MIVISLIVWSSMRSAEYLIFCKIISARLFDHAVLMPPGATSVPTPPTLCRHLTGMGLDPLKSILVYDAEDSLSQAPRTFMLLKLLGAQHVAVLEGGLQQWRGPRNDATSPTPRGTHTSAPIGTISQWWTAYTPTAHDTTTDWTCPQSPPPLPSTSVTPRWCFWRDIPWAPERRDEALQQLQAHAERHDDVCAFALSPEFSENQSLMQGAGPAIGGGAPGGLSAAASIERRRRALGLAPPQTSGVAAASTSARPTSVNASPFALPTHCHGVVPDLLFPLTPLQTVCEFPPPRLLDTNELRTKLTRWQMPRDRPVVVACRTGNISTRCISLCSRFGW
jgi:hypothetical protein